MLPQNEIISVRAKVHLRPTNEGGRTTGIKTRYRPNHVFEPVSDTKMLKSYIGQIEFDKSEVINPGETAEVTVRFLWNPVIEKYMNIGQKWLIYEVPRLIGEGEIIEIESR